MSFQESYLSCVPSMVDLLLEGRCNVEEDNKFHTPTRDDEEPMFRTGSGKPVFFSHSSVAKATTVLRGCNEDDVKSGLTPSVGERADEKGKLPTSKSSLLSDTGFGMSFNQSNRDDCSPQFRTPGKQVDEKSDESVANAFRFLTPNGERFKPHSVGKENAVSSQTNGSIKFQTAGGKMLSVSRDALQRARSLLGETESDGLFSEKSASIPSNFVAEGDTPSGRNSPSSFTNPRSLKAKFLKNSFISPFKPNHPSFYASSESERSIVGENLMNKFNEADENSTSNGTLVHNTPANGVKYSVNRGRALNDISNTAPLTRKNFKISNNDMKRSARKSFARSFKKPRRSNPLNQDCSNMRNDFDATTIPRTVVSCRFPVTVPRVYIKDYLASLTHKCKLYVNPPAEVQKDGDVVVNMETEILQNMLIQSGALLNCVSREWVANHYKWITWKLASYDKNDHFKFPAKLLTPANVIEEIKYRYEREVNHGHRSAIRRILDGDAPASSLMVLCISSIQCSDEHSAKVELTDGWYAVSAVLDVHLSRHLANGKLMVGQKLRIWGASLHGWLGPISPLEASDSVTFVLHINGTYRAHWGDRLGFCKNSGYPLALRCIKTEGGPVPRTLVGVSRIYPTVYREKLSNGDSILRCQWLERQLAKSLNERRASFVEAVTSEFRKKYDESKRLIDNDSEGAELYNKLERAAEPDILMADMSPRQLSAFASYQSKLEAMKQMDLQKTIAKALKESNLHERQVTPLMRVKVRGLSSSQNKPALREALITLRHPTHRQENELLEGEAYVVEGLTPASSSSITLYLEGMGNSTEWRPLTSQAIHDYTPFFVRRVAIPAAKMEGVALGSEFDAIGYVIHVAEARSVNRSREQWVFISDKSKTILAIRYWWYCLADDPFTVSNCAGSVVGFCNLVKRPKDEANHFWVADASQNSNFYLDFESSKSVHFIKRATSIEKWAKKFPRALKYLKSQVLSAIDG